MLVAGFGGRQQGEKRGPVYDWPMRVALIQINPTIGDVAGTLASLEAAFSDALEAGADVLVTSELILPGYPPRDLLLRADVVEQCELAVRRLAKSVPEGVTALVGHVRRVDDGVSRRPLRNSVSVMRGRCIEQVYDKRLLPGYDVFDEDRYFSPGSEPLVIDVDGRRIGVLACEDLWQAEDVSLEVRYEQRPVDDLASMECDAVVALNASPFVQNKWRRHVRQTADAAMRIGAPIVAVNQVGGQDDLVFDGRSIVIDAAGRLVHVSSGWCESVDIIDIEDLPGPVSLDVDPMAELFDALVLGLGDYVRKTGHSDVLLGLSGGIDSALTAVIAARALGPQYVHGWLMPSKYSSPGSLDDAHALAHNLAMANVETVPIETMHDAGRAALRDVLGDRMEGLTDENLQARLRGLLLMAGSNASGALLLATGNKSELAVGYSTIYGDMCGAVSVVGDLVKTRVYELSRWINENHTRIGFDVPPIPEASITKPPSAELRPNQRDEDTLMPYDQLDQIIIGLVDREQSAERVSIETGIDVDVVRRFAGMIDRTQYKRDQASVILKVSPRTFGRGRVMPIVMRQTSVPDVDRDCDAGMLSTDDAKHAPADSRS